MEQEGTGPILPKNATDTVKRGDAAARERDWRRMSSKRGQQFREYMRVLFDTVDWLRDAEGTLLIKMDARQNNPPFQLIFDRYIYFFPFDAR